MSGLNVESKVTWRVVQREGGGILTTGGQEMVFSAPPSMGGRGDGTSPQELLISAFAPCHW